ncbi:DUF1642 domain-containing protein [Streptococcus intermedius]|uniref:DUF1642 domain-containing protein n=1 Tax=Streptococcus intermedius TaxID=1338 RepID=UPI00339608F8
MKYKLGDEVYLKGVITSINSCAEINYPYEVKTAGEFVTAAEEHLEPINKSELGHAEEAPRYLRNILARLRGLPEHDREVWMDEIMHEFANDYGSVKHTLGYEQGKFDGAFEREKLKTPQFIADKIEYCKKIDGYRLFNAMDYCYSFKKCAEWLESNEKNFALAWIFGYEVEKEKRYFVKIRATKHCFAKDGNGKIFFSLAYKGCFTKKELEDADFGWVFDCEGVEVQEVE